MGDIKTITFKVPGDMTIYEAAELHPILVDAINNHEKVCIDLSQVSEIDSSGLQLMIAVKKAADQANKTIVFESHSEAVIELIDIFEMSSYFGDPIVMENQNEVTNN